MNPSLIQLHLADAFQSDRFNARRIRTPRRQRQS